VSCNPLVSDLCGNANYTDGSASAYFTVRAADYCDGQRALVIDGMPCAYPTSRGWPCTDALLAHHTTPHRTAGVIFIKAFVTQRALSRTALQQTRGFLVGEYTYMTLFIDTDRSLKV
jgi:hypothetical protein